MNLCIVSLKYKLLIELGIKCGIFRTFTTNCCLLKFGGFVLICTKLSYIFLWISKLFYLSGQSDSLFLFGWNCRCCACVSKHDQSFNFVQVYLSVLTGKHEWNVVQMAFIGESTLLYGRFVYLAWLLELLSLE